MAVVKLRRCCAALPPCVLLLQARPPPLCTCCTCCDAPLALRRPSSHALRCGELWGSEWGRKKRDPSTHTLRYATEVWDLQTVACGLCFWLSCGSLADAAPRFSLPLALPHPSTPHTAYPLTPHTLSYAPHPPVSAWLLPQVASSLLQGAGETDVFEAQQLVPMVCDLITFLARRAPSPRCSQT